jgi:hypothetical protein
MSAVLRNYPSEMPWADPGSSDPLVVYYYKINRKTGEFGEGQQVEWQH